MSISDVVDKRLFVSILLLFSLSTVVTAANATANQTQNATTPPPIGPGGFGEFGGHLVYNLSSGTSHKEYWTLVNKFSYPVSFYIVPPNFSKSSQSPPTLVFSELNGTIPAHTNLTLTVTAYSPSWTSYLFASNSSYWSGYATAYAQPVSAASGGASVAIGTAKLIEITVQPPHMLPMLVAIIIAVIVIIIVAILYIRRRKRK